MTFISTMYGQARGYHRLDIRRRVTANEWLAPNALTRTSSQELQHHIHRSIARFPPYAERVKAHRGSLPKPGAPVRLEELPVWTRADQREFFDQQSRPPDAAYMRRSSGSTSTPVRLYVTRESYEWRTAIMDRVYAWAHAQEGVRSVHVWGRDLTLPTRWHHIKRSVHLVLQRRYFFDAFKEFSEQERAACCRFINRIKPEAIVGYTGMLVDIARYSRETHALTWKARTLVATAEGLQGGQRELLEETLASEVFDSYGSREVMNIGMECEKHTGLHLASDNVVVEVVDEAGNPVPAGAEGRIVVTDFHNAASPIIRYDMGDIGVMGPDELCACGRPFPRLARVEGRSQDLVYTPQGSTTAILLCFAIREYDWIDGFQIVQSTRDRILLRLLTRSPITPGMVQPLIDRLRPMLKGMTIDYERVGTLARRPNGKFQLLISEVEPGR
ncbi:MAG TPA: AMP-binding protein [Candidatus Krumholzibacteria bacterium]|nr:AMP-binding protein [Candidatus Krumholzibacteria bacterium]